MPSFIAPFAECVSSDHFMRHKRPAPSRVHTVEWARDTETLESARNISHRLRTPGSHSRPLLTSLKTSFITSAKEIHNDDRTFIYFEDLGKVIETLEMNGIKHENDSKPNQIIIMTNEWSQATYWPSSDYNPGTEDNLMKKAHGNRYSNSVSVWVFGSEVRVESPWFLLLHGLNPASDPVTKTCQQRSTRRTHEGHGVC